VTLSRDGKRVLTGAHDKTAILWDAASGAKVQTFRAPAELECVALSGDGKRVVTGGWDKTAILWDTASGKALQTFEGHALLVRGVALSGDGKHVLTGSADKTAILWEAASGKKLQTFAGHNSVVTCVAFSSDGKQVVTGSYDAKAILWDASSGRRLQTYPGVVLSVALSSDDRHVLAGVNLWEAASARKLQTFQEAGGVSGVALSGDGKHAWTAATDGTTRLWDPVTGKERCRLYSLDRGKDWLVTTPAGFFDGSEAAWRLVTYRVPGTLKLIEDDATRRRFHRPGLLAQIWKGDR
jgi:WD40 repeat protein